MSGSADYQATILAYYGVTLSVRSHHVLRHALPQSWFDILLPMDKQIKRVGLYVPDPTGKLKIWPSSMHEIYIYIDPIWVREVGLRRLVACGVGFLALMRRFRGLVPYKIICDERLQFDRFAPKSKNLIV